MELLQLTGLVVILLCRTLCTEGRTELRLIIPEAFRAEWDQAMADLASRGDQDSLDRKKSSGSSDSSDSVLRAPCFADCSVTIERRKSCGYSGQSKSKCLAKNCCWDDGATSRNKSQCYEKDIEKCDDPMCAKIPRDERVQCTSLKESMEKHVEKTSCMRAGCCWDPTPSSNLSCYILTLPRVPTTPCKATKSEDRENCGWRGITEPECEARGCYYETIKENGTCWFFKSGSKRPTVEKHLSSTDTTSTFTPALTQATTETPSLPLSPVPSVDGATTLNIAVDSQAQFRNQTSPAIVGDDASSNLTPTHLGLTESYAMVSVEAALGDVTGDAAPTTTLFQDAQVSDPSMSKQVPQTNVSDHGATSTPTSAMASPIASSLDISPATGTNHRSIITSTVPTSPTSTSITITSPSSTNTPSTSTISTSTSSTSTISTSTSSTSTISTSIPSTSTISIGTPSTSAISTSFPSTSTISTSIPSTSTISIGTPSTSTISTSIPSTSTISIGTPSTSAISTSFPSTSTISTSIPSTSTISTSTPSTSTTRTRTTSTGTARTRQIESFSTRATTTARSFLVSSQLPLFVSKTPRYTATSFYIANGRRSPMPFVDLKPTKGMDDLMFNNVKKENLVNSAASNTVSNVYSAIRAQRQKNLVACMLSNKFCSLALLQQNGSPRKGRVVQNTPTQQSQLYRTATRGTTSNFVEPLISNPQASDSSRLSGFGVTSLTNSAAQGSTTRNAKKNRPSWLTPVCSLPGVLSSRFSPKIRKMCGFMQVMNNIVETPVLEPSEMEKILLVGNSLPKTTNTNGEQSVQGRKFTMTGNPVTTSNSLHDGSACDAARYKQRIHKVQYPCRDEFFTLINRKEECLNAGCCWVDTMQTAFMDLLNLQGNSITNLYLSRMLNQRNHFNCIKSLSSPMLQALYLMSLQRYSYDQPNLLSSYLGTNNLGGSNTLSINKASDGDEEHSAPEATSARCDLMGGRVSCRLNDEPILSGLICISQGCCWFPNIENSREDDCFLPVDQ